jgi:hypothetical protein
MSDKLLQAKKVLFSIFLLWFPIIEIGGDLHNCERLLIGLSAQAMSPSPIGESLTIAWDFLQSGPEIVNILNIEFMMVFFFFFFFFFF